jgi:riboflavin transporter FmnP
MFKFLRKRHEKKNVMDLPTLIEKVGMKLSETAVSLIVKNVLKFLPQHKGVEVRYCDGLQVHWCLFCLQCLELVP